MKSIILALISHFSKLILLVRYRDSSVLSNTYYLARFSSPRFKNISAYRTIFRRTFVSIVGTNNSININDSSIHDTIIKITGDGNNITIEKNTILRKMEIVIKGENCSVTIGAHTTFGGARIINAGNGNRIDIGEDCLFSDKIEIWGSDTHDILNETNTVINKEKPIRIGNKVWVGSNVTILKGSLIGDNSIIGINSTVTTTVPGGVIAVGNPTRVIKNNIHWRRDEDR